jgi:Tfp pilus assembly PilM family ATPase
VLEDGEKIKKKYGLQRNTENKEIFAILLNSVSILRDELVKHFLYWHTHKDEKGKTNPPIKKIILSGGDSNLIGLSDYLSMSMKSETEMADVWINIMKTEKYIPDISFKEALSFATSLGLALRDSEHGTYF